MSKHSQLSLGYFFFFFPLHSSEHFLYNIIIYVQVHIINLTNLMWRGKGVHFLKRERERERERERKRERERGVKGRQTDFVWHSCYIIYKLGLPIGLNRYECLLPVSYITIYPEHPSPTHGQSTSKQNIPPLFQNPHKTETANDRILTMRKKCRFMSAIIARNSILIQFGMNTLLETDTIPSPSVWQRGL